jgi:hypothetical protein
VAGVSASGSGLPSPPRPAPPPHAGASAHDDSDNDSDKRRAARPFLLPGHVARPATSEFMIFHIAERRPGRPRTLHRGNTTSRIADACHPLPGFGRRGFGKCGLAERPRAARRPLPWGVDPAETEQTVVPHVLQQVGSSGTRWPSGPFLAGAVPNSCCKSPRRADADEGALRERQGLAASPPRRLAVERLSRDAGVGAGGHSPTRIR